MSFQSTVRLNQTDGIVGDIAFDGPLRANPGILESADAANNVIGRAMFRLADEDLKMAAEGADTLVFAGILSNSKVYALEGDAASSLNPTLTLPNQTEVEVVDMGYIYVNSLDAVSIGDDVYASNTTGELQSTAGAGFTQIPNAKFDLRNTDAAGLAIVRLTN